GRNVIDRNYATVHALGSNEVRGLLQTSDGMVWAATAQGLTYFDSGGLHLHTYTKNDGLVNESLSALAEDKEGNLWIGTQGAGVMKILRKGFLSYNQSTVGDFGPVHSITNSKDRQMYIISGDWLVHRVDGQKLS